MRKDEPPADVELFEQLRLMLNLLPPEERQQGIVAAIEKVAGSGGAACADPRARKTNDRSRPGTDRVDLIGISSAGAYPRSFTSLRAVSAILPSGGWNGKLPA